MCATLGARVLLARCGEALELALALVAACARVCERVAQLAYLLPRVGALRKRVGAHVGLERLAVLRVLGAELGETARAELGVQLALGDCAWVQENVPVRYVLCACVCKHEKKSVNAHTKHRLPPARVDADISVYTPRFKAWCTSASSARVCASMKKKA